MQLNLLEKTELKIYGLILREVNLSKVAAVVAGVLELPPAEVLVVDVRPDHICLDILSKSMDIKQIIGKEQLLLAQLAGVDGLELAVDPLLGLGLAGPGCLPQRQRRGGERDRLELHLHCCLLTRTLPGGWMGAGAGGESAGPFYKNVSYSRLLLLGSR